MAAILLWMAIVALVARPLVSTAHDLIKNQIIAGPVANRVRWLTHRYVLRQSLGFFQNDFAGRVANKVMQAAPALREFVVQVIDAIWYAAVQWVGAAVIFAAADWRLLLPLLALARRLHRRASAISCPRIKERSTEAAEARSMLIGRIVDSYTNILTVKLFAHADREDGYARAALEEQMGKWQASLRLADRAWSCVLYTLNGLLIVGATGCRHLAVERTTSSRIGAIAVVIGLVCASSACRGWIMWEVAGIFENIGVVQEGMETIAAPNQVVDRPDARPLVVRAGRDPLRGRQLPLRRASTPDGQARRRHRRLVAARSGRARRSAWSAAPAPASRRWSTCCCASTTSKAGRILIDGQDIAARHAGQPARADRHGDAGHLAAAPLGARQHPLRPARTPARRRRSRRRASAAGARFHRRRSRI